jgi:prepilin-type N-terminal cleavage/methylation domain-containing protein
MNAYRKKLFFADSANGFQRAFTLLELLIVIGLIGLLTFVAVPAFKGFGQANTLAAAQRQIQDDLALARQLAIKNRVPVYMVFFSPDADSPDQLGVNSPGKLSDIHNALLGLTASEFKVRSLRVFTNVFAGQHVSYAFYTESKVGDQPVVLPQDGSSDLSRSRYLTLGGSIWRTLPDGIVFAPGLRFRLKEYFAVSLTNKPVPFPLAPSPGDLTLSQAQTLQLHLPAIAYDALGRSMRMDKDGRITAQLQDQFVSLGIGSVFIPHDPIETNHFDFSKLADVVETPRENYTNSIYRINGLTGRARRFVWGTSL